MTLDGLTTMTCSIEDGLARLTLARPERGNPIDGAFSRELRDLAVAFQTRGDVRAVLLTAAPGKAFSVGGDIRSFVADRSALPKLVLDWTADLHSALARFQRMDAPVVCAVDGAAAGGSVSLVASADIVYASDTSSFASAFASIGFSADSGSTLTLSVRMGLQRAKRFVLLSEVLKAGEACEAGLVDFVLPAADVAAAAEATARRLAAGPTKAYGGIKRTFLSARTEGLEAQLEHEAQTLAALSVTDDAWEGLMGFTQKRRPEFRGR